MDLYILRINEFDALKVLTKKSYSKSWKIDVNINSFGMEERNMVNINDELLRVLLSTLVEAVSVLSDPIAADLMDVSFPMLTKLYN